MAVRFGVLSLLAGASAMQCFPDGIPETERKNVSDGNEHYPIGQWILQHPAGYVMAAVSQILIEEKLGYALVQQGGPTTIDSFFGLAGCSQPTNNANRGCDLGPKKTYNHFALEAWTSGNQLAWDQIQMDLPDTAPVLLGNIGYNGWSSYYVPSSVLSEAYGAEGLSLDFYREYNTSWNDPWQYFTSPVSINKSRLLPCSQTTLVRSSDMMTLYPELTGDNEGVESTDDGIVAKCFDQRFWYAPTCRSNASTCIVTLTGGVGWGVEECMQKATMLNMPLAIAVAASWYDYTNLPLVSKVLFYWWVPDPTFLSLSPTKITYPPYDRSDWARGGMSTEAAYISVDKLASHDLSSLAPDTFQLLTSLIIDIRDVEKMLRDQLASSDSWFEVACRWLQENEQTWGPWMPDKTKCSLHFGLFNEKDELWVEDRSEPQYLRCSACPSGTYSERLEDGFGVTHVCRKCPAGTYQDSGASVSCIPCPVGESQNATGSIACKRCVQGEYQDQIGQSSCIRCIPGTTTLGLGSREQGDCGCDETTINIAEPGAEPECAPCGEGLDCPFASTATSLRLGESSLGSKHVARVVEGYFAPKDEPLKVYKCRPLAHCPGGQPGQCAGGLDGVPCATCRAGQVKRGDHCDDCGAESWLLILFMSIAFLAVTFAYYVMNSKVAPHTSPPEAALMALIVSVNSVQFIAMYGLMTVRWTGEVTQTSSALQFLILDIDALSLTCLASSSPAQYLLASLAFPAVAAWLLYAHLLSRVMARAVPRAGRWQLPNTFNTIGAMLQMGFSAMSATALQPFMCYEHPNGLRSIANYPGVICGSSEHTSMAIIGIALLLFTAGYLACCLVASLKMPSWSERGAAGWVQSFRFLTSKFRLDAWFFGIVIPLRGLCFSLVIVFTTDLPPAQVAFGTMILLIYAGLQARCWPWKAEAINFADMCCNGCLLLLLGTSAGESGFEGFTQAFALAILMVLGSIVVVCWATISASALHRYVFKGDGKMWIDGRTHDAGKVSTALTLCAEKLLELGHDELYGKVKALNKYDLHIITSAITLVSLEVVSDRTCRFSSRVQLVSFNANRSSRRATRELSGEDQKLPNEAMPSASVPSAADHETNATLGCLAVDSNGAECVSEDEKLPSIIGTEL